MQPHKYIIPIFCLVAGISSCEQKTKQTVREKADYIVIKGKLDNIEDRASIIVDRKDYPLSLNENGSFNDTILDIEQGKVVDFWVDDYFMKLYLRPGTEIEINADVANIVESMSVSGLPTDVTINNYFLTKEKLMDKVNRQYDKEERYRIDLEEFVSEYKAVEDSLSNLLNTNTEIPEVVKKMERQDLEFYVLDALYGYKMVKDNLGTDAFAEFSKVFINFPRKYLDQMAAVAYDDFELYEYSFNYNNFMDARNYDAALELAEREGMAIELAELEIAKGIPNEKIRNRVIFNNFQMNVDQVENLTEYYNAYMAMTTEETDKEQATEIYNNFLTIAKGEPSPKFTDYENVKGGTASLDDFKGKYVYIDLWATWCMPCIAEIPFLKKIEEAYRNKNIEFVSISIDTDKAYNRWKNIVSKKALGGVQLLADKNWDSQFLLDYKVDGIPRFILIGPDGRIVDATAPRPSDPELRLLFDEVGL
ncbi:TlpA family protein disulfide reductase [Maribacter sp. 2210JD10-5]|uniref:TlpA family protein disulfide reductase n=1 Tax=Maribacter sp. 2210JD10-5 TaxID=3386272 RepID=UPI0039BD56A3